MPQFNEQLSEALSLYDKVDPSNAAAGTQNSSGIDLQKFRRVIFSVQVGAITGAGTLDVKMQSSANSNFNVVHNFTGGAITQITNANPNNLVTLETNDEYVVSQNSGDRYVRVQCVVTTNNVIYGVVGYGGVPAQNPAKAQDSSTLALQRLVAQ